MNVILIDPEICEVNNWETDDDLNDFARKWIRCDIIDHALITRYSEGRSLHIIVYENGLIGGPHASTRYFALGRHLFNGRAILYAAHHGKTIDAPDNLARHFNGDCPDFHWIATANVAEKFMVDGKLDRPTRTYNGEVLWQWKPGIDFEKHQAEQQEAIKAYLDKHGI